MNKQEIELLEQCREEIQNCYGRDTDLTEKISDYLEQQLTNGWISVSENGNPCVSGYYLVTALGGVIEKKPFIEYAYYEEGTSCKWYMIADGKEEEHQQWKEELKCVIAWQPLPEPYKEASHE